MKDPHGRVIDRLRISVTDRCDLRCFYCMPATGVHFAPQGDLLTYGEIEEFARFLVEERGLTKVRITGGEPLVRPRLHDLVRRLGALGLRDLALTTNGQLLEQQAEALRDAGLRRVNISLDTLRPDRYRALGRAGEVARTLRGIDKALDLGLVPVKLNVVLLRGVNDDEIVDLVRFGIERDIEVRFLELMAIGEAGALHGERFFSMDDALAGLRSVYSMTERPRANGSTASEFHVSDGNGLSGRVGFIAPVTHAFCGRCGRLRLSAAGILRGCLMEERGVDVRSLLRGPAAERRKALAAAWEEAVGLKPWVSSMRTDTLMHELGG